MNRKDILMSGTQATEANEISLFDLLEKLRRGWVFILGGVLSGLVASTVAIILVSPKYEAVAILQMGKVAGAVVEEPPLVVERLKSPALLSEIAQKLNDDDWLDDINHGRGGNILTAMVPKATPSLVELKIKGKSEDAAKKIAQIATELLIKRQNELSKTTLTKIHFDLDVAKEKLESVQEEVAALSKAVNSFQMKDTQFSQAALLTSLRLQKEAEMFGLRQTVNNLEISLLPPATQSAKVLEDIFASKMPVSPRKTLLLGFGLFGGFLLGVMLLFFADAWKLARERHIGR